jgi:iron(III) transport system substrate-binding protein
VKRALPLLALALAACAGGNGKQALVIYSPHGRDLLAAFEQRFEVAHPDVDVQWIDMGSEEVLDRLRSERANPQADVWFGAPSEMFARGVQEGLLAVDTPSWAGDLPADARDAGYHWFGTYVTPEVIAFNSQAVPADSAPHDWDDLLAPRWKGQVLIRDPLASGTMRTSFGMIIERSLRSTSDTAAGFAWLRRLDAQTKEYVLNPTLLYQKLARQEGLVTVWDMPDIELLRRKSGLPIDYTFPRSGTPLVVDAIAIPAGAPHPRLAREFIDFVGDEANLIYAAREFFRLPARQDIPTDSLPPSLQRARRDIVPEPMDWSLLEQRAPAWMRYWDEHVRGHG